MSVVVPTYGHRDFVLATLESVFAQTFIDREVVVINDGSPDDTAELLQPLAESGRIRYVEQPNAGQAAARNRGLELARGEFVAFLDDDDLLPADKLERQVSALRALPDVALVGGWATLIDAEGRVVGEHGAPEGEFTTRDLARGCPFYSPGQTLVRRSALEAVGGFDESLWGADDYDVYVRLSAMGPLRIERRVALLYRVHGSNASHRRDRMFANVHATIRKHFLAGPADVRRDAYRWLYSYAGGDLARRLRGELKSLDAAGAWRTASTLRVLAGPAVRDRTLARQVARDLLPRDGRAFRALRRSFR